MFALDDTIAAIASASGGAARGIVRLSGPKTFDIVRRCWNGDESNSITPAFSRAHVFAGQFFVESVVIPADLFLWPEGRSYTRQLLAEFHTFGSPPLLDAILKTVCRAGARLAEPGEFTLRAFLAGRIDLTQAEAVLGVIDAADRNQLHIALEQLAGGLARPVEQLRSDLLDLLADLEAGLDFVEDDIRFIAPDELSRRLDAAAAIINRIAAQLAARETSTVRPRVALVGRANVGKSSLFNALVDGAAALVSSQAGTTRDYLTATIDAQGILIDLVDTAGVLDHPSPVVVDNSAELTGLAQKSSAAQFDQSDLRLLCIDSTRPINGWERTQLSADRILPVMTKCDRPKACDLLIRGVTTSSHTRTGMEALLAAIYAELVASHSEGSAVAGTAARAKESIRIASDDLTAARNLAATHAGDELVAARIRSTLTELGKIVGAIYTDDLLDRIFSRFCIGK